MKTLKIGKNIIKKYKNRTAVKKNLKNEKIVKKIINKKRANNLLVNDFVVGAFSTRNAYRFSASVQVTAVSNLFATD